MAQTIEELVQLGLSEAEAERVISRRAKAAEKQEKQVELAKARIDSAREKYEYAASRARHWQGTADEAKARVEKYEAIINGDSDEEVGDEDGTED